MPKGPSRTKNSTESEFRYGEKIGNGRSKTLRRGLRNACFSRTKRQENGTAYEKLRRQQNTTDSSAVLFLVRMGPLGGQTRQSPIASDFGSRTQIAALFAVLLYQSV